MVASIKLFIPFMTHSLEKLIIKLPKVLFSKESWKTLGEYIGLGRLVENSPIEDFASLKKFIETRSSHVAQTSLYGYLKTRAGTRFPEMFEDPNLLMSINMAKWQVYLGCLSDLSVYLGALVFHRSDAGAGEISDLLSRVIKEITEQTGIPDEASDEFPDTVEALTIRVANADYAGIPDDETAFSISPDMLFHWSPIAEELKNRDREIVKNSIRFRWKDIRISARSLLDAEALMESARN